MYQVSSEEFESFVQEGTDAIPEKFRTLIKNVAFVTEDEPTAKQRKENNLGPDETLFGLYEGIPQTARGENYGGLVLPDKITVFQNPIEDESFTRGEVRGHVIDTVWHEVAHYFGLDETAVERREKERGVPEG